MASNTAEDVESFLNKVEEIESIVKGLNSGDDDQLKTAMHKADEFIKSQKTKSNDKDEEKDLPKTTTGFSKTVINKKRAEDTATASAANMSSTDQAAFMAALEADAKERSERRKVREKEAQVIKEMGNQAFKEENFEKALEYYNQAIDKVRDNAMLYTNRAQTWIKLGKYEEALSDCDWALRANPKSIKAYVHMGRAHLALKHYQEARDSFSKVLTVDASKECMIQAYQAEVDRAEAVSTAEKKAQELFAAGDTDAQGLVQVLDRVKKPDHLPLYYTGGFTLLTDLLAKEENQTQFRIQGGMQLLQDNCILSRCMTSALQSFTKEERELVIAALNMFGQACRDNDCNQEHLLKQEGLTERLLQLLSAKVKERATPVKTAVLSLLHTISQSEHGRYLIVQHFDTLRLLSVLLDLIRTKKSCAHKAGSVFNNLSLEKKFRSTMRDKMADVLPGFEELLKDSECDSGVVSVCISAMMNLANDQTLRKSLACRRSLWLATEEILVRTSTGADSDLLTSVLGLVVNFTSDSTASATLLEFGQRMCAHCRSLLPTQCPTEAAPVPFRALVVMGNILPHSLPAVEWICSHGGVQLLLTYMKSGEPALLKHSLKCLTALTQFNTKARNTLVENNGIPELAKLIRTKDEGNVGNAALCLSHCTQVSNVCASLADTDIIKETLLWARDGKKSAVQRNCLILLAKLANGHSRHLERLRELHGIKILHDCMNEIGGVF